VIRDCVVIWHGGVNGEQCVMEYPRDLEAVFSDIKSTYKETRIGLVFIT